MLGFIESYNREKGFGYIFTEHGRNLFFHISQFKKGLKPKERQIVSFDQRLDHKSKVCAFEVYPIETIRYEPHKLFKEIANWKLEAKLEDTDRYFYYSEDLDYLKDGSRCYVIGRKGTGKTAISEFFFKNKGPTTFSQKLTFKNFPFAELYSLSDGNYNPPNQYITFWKLLIYSTIVQMMIENENIDIGMRDKLNKIYPISPLSSLRERISEWTQGTFSLKFFGSGIDVGVGRQSHKNETSWISRVLVMEKMIKKYIDAAYYYILFDELDEDYKYSLDFQNSDYMFLLTSLFKAVQDVKAIFPPNEFNINPIIFIRDDIYDLIRDPDKTKWNDLSVELKWDDGKLRKLIGYRLLRAIDSTAAGNSFEQIWGSIFRIECVKTGNSKSDSLFNIIKKNTLLRPRDFIRYLQCCAQYVLDRDERTIGSFAIKASEDSFSNYFMSELIDESYPVINEIADVFKVLRRLGKQTFSYNDFMGCYQDYLNDAKTENKSIHCKEILNVLFYFSVIGNVDKQSAIIFRFLKKEANFNPDLPIIIHRGLFKALCLI
jgi:cold shock CspA family protein